MIPMANPATRTDAAGSTGIRSQLGASLPHSRTAIERAVLVFILLTAVAIGFAGIKKNLPFTQESDESIFVGRAVEMVSTGDLNPHWFGNPGSTVIYPLAAAYGVWHAVTDGGNIIPPDGDIRANFEADSDDYYYIGRSLTILYFVGTVLLTYLVGRRVLSTAAGLAAALFIAASVPFVEHAQIVRTDSAGAFFGMLGLFFILQVEEKPTAPNRILAGGAIGLAVSSRYFLVALIPVLAAAELIVLLRRRSHQTAISVNDLAYPLIGPIAAFAAFVISTPYFFPDFDTARENIQNEARSTHLGADGLSRPENFIWYFRSAIPDAITPPVAILALAGTIIALVRRNVALLLCIAYGLIFIVGTSYSRLHWQRWIIPVLPVAGILAAYAMQETVSGISRRLRLPASAVPAATVLAIALLLVWPAASTALHDVRDARPSTRLLAREWIIDNLPAGARVTGEWYTAPLTGTSFHYSMPFSLFQSNTLDTYKTEGVQYVVASSDIYDRYYAEPELYATIVERYDVLFAEELIQEFRPGITRGGPTIRIYELNQPD